MEQKEIIKSVRAHFGLKENGIRQDPDQYDDEFEITFDVVAPYAPRPKWYGIEVVSKEIAIRNRKDFLIGTNEDVEITENTIDYYTRIIGTDLYFRWY